MFEKHSSGAFVLDAVGDPSEGLVYRTAAFLMQQFLLVVTDLVYPVVVVLHLLHLAQLTVVETDLSDARQRHFLSSFFNPIEGYLFLKA